MLNSERITSILTQPYPPVVARVFLSFSHPPPERISIIEKTY